MLTFFHTSPVHVQTFNRLLEDVPTPPPVRHRVEESLLREALETGAVTPAMADRVKEKLIEAAEGSTVVLCTCSTLGGVAEAIGHEWGINVIRVDRPMAEHAVSLGARILLFATLPSTLPPTRELLLDEASKQEKSVRIVDHLCDRAWKRFEDGDRDGYEREIAEEIRSIADPGDVAVLAQASMAGAGRYCADLPISVLSSPRLGLQAALNTYAAATYQK